MRTTLDLPEKLIKEAQKAVGANTKTQAIVLALTEAIQKRKSKKILELEGSLKYPYDYKSLRRKR